MPLWKPLHSNWLCSNLAEICQVVLKQRVENVNILQTDGRTGIWMPDKKWSEIKSLCMSHFTILKLSSYGNNGLYMFRYWLFVFMVARACHVWNRRCYWFYCSHEFIPIFTIILQWKKHNDLNGYTTYFKYCYFK